MKTTEKKAKSKQPLPKKEAPVPTEVSKKPLTKPGEVKKETDVAPAAKAQAETSSSVKETKAKKKPKEKEKVKQPVPKKAVPAKTATDKKGSNAVPASETDAKTDAEADIKVDKKKGKKKGKKKATASTKEKTLCKCVKNDYLKTKLTDYKGFVENPKWVCKKCGRVSNNEKLLCKPELI